MRCLWYVYAVSTGFLWDFYGIDMGFPWCFYGIALGFLKDFFAVSTGFLWDFIDVCDISKGFLLNILLIFRCLLVIKENALKVNGYLSSPYLPLDLGLKGKSVESKLKPIEILSYQ